MATAARFFSEEEKCGVTPHIELLGAFDHRAARRTLEAVRRQAGRGEVLLLDFSKVEFLDDSALATLVYELRGMPEVRLLTRGLRSHPARLLQYLRVDPSTLGPVVEGAAKAPARWNSDLDP